MKIVQITACPVQKNGKSYSNVYGLGDDNRVYSWNAKDAAWQPHKVTSAPRGEQW
jgi:hypothetical protein